MGGYGSRRPVERAVFEDGFPLDLGKLIRDGLIRPGMWKSSLIWRWVRTGEETASANYIATMDEAARSGVLQLSYRMTVRGEQHDIVEPIPLEALPQPFGGLMWYFRCPVTERRCRKLYLLPGGLRFAARQAWRAGYLSQRQAPHDRALEQAFKIRKRLGNSSGIGMPIDRPCGMHRTTYERHMERLEHYEEVVEGHLRQFLIDADRRFPQRP